MQELIIVGAGGFARELAWQVDEFIKATKGSLFMKGFVIGRKPVTDKMAAGAFPVLGNDEWALENLDRSVKFLSAIGHSPVRRKVAEMYTEAGFQSLVFTHHSVNTAGPIKIGTGTMFCMGSSITGDTVIGKHVLVNLNCTIGHDCRIGDYATLHPGVHLSGNVEVGSMAEIGTGAVVLPSKKIGEGAIIGAGAVVREDVPAGETWVGVPAKKVTST